MEELEKLSNKIKSKSVVSLTVVNVGRQRCRPLYTWGPGVRDHFLIHYIRKGRGRYHVDGKIYELSAGDVFLAYPDTEIRYQADAEDPWTYEWVGFSGSDAGYLVYATDFSKEEPVLRGISYGEEVSDCLRRINDAFGNSVECAARMTGFLYLLLASFVRHAEHAAAAERSSGETVRKAVEFVSSRYSYSLTVQEIADFAGVSRSTLFRAFSDELGMSPKEYLDSFRIRRAAELLRGTTLTMDSIASSVGYDNGLYFSKAFRRHMGVAPSEYRRQDAAE